MIKNVIFDVGNVLVSFCWRELMEDLGIAKELQAVFETTVFGSPWWGELDRGVIAEAEVLKKLRAENSAHLAEFDLIWSNRDKLVKPFDYAVDMIKNLKDKGMKVYLLSNYPKDLFTLHTQCGRFPFIDLVDGKVVSGFVQLVKPEREIYECLLDTYGLIAEECVFVDDRAENVEAAKAMGINGVWFWDYEQCWREIGKLIG